MKKKTEMKMKLHIVQLLSLFHRWESFKCNNECRISKTRPLKKWLLYSCTAHVTVIWLHFVCVCEWSEPVQNNGQFNKADFYSIANYIECRLEHVSCSCIYPITPHVFSSHAPTHSAMLQIYIALRNRDQEEVEKKCRAKEKKRQNWRWCQKLVGKQLLRLKTAHSHTPNNKKRSHKISTHQLSPK